MKVLNLLTNTVFIHSRVVEPIRIGFQNRKDGEGEHSLKYIFLPYISWYKCDVSLKYVLP